MYSRSKIISLTDVELVGITAEDVNEEGHKLFIAHSTSATRSELVELLRAFDANLASLLFLKASSSPAESHEQAKPGAGLYLAKRVEWVSDGARTRGIQLHKLALYH